METELNIFYKLDLIGLADGCYVGDVGKSSQG